MSERSQQVASGSDPFDDWSFDTKAAENSHIPWPPQPAVATVATVAAPDQVFPWSEGLAQLCAMVRPERVRPEVWDELINEAGDVSRIWGARALECGWNPLDLFGCNPDPYARRNDRNGLVKLLVNFLTPLRIVDITPEFAALSDPHGGILRFRTGWRRGQVYLWEAYCSESGP